ncbi:hypothetical protein SAR03_09450 [Staphylococcus arlettae]|uniref:Ribosomal protein L7Ae-like n=1 Tax=Staphylococcus arlettae TaxID=29378 RepID=A0A380CSV1_9STAP|nr:hypothetical protein SAR03_09450 [Staphylococcus arlettae]SUJ26896.1 ribosomal protein L7Ae-like [Staphylococcus arlettae]
MSNEKVARFNKQHYVIGQRQTLKALSNDQVTSLIIAEDVEVYVLSRVLSQINLQTMPISFFCEQTSFRRMCRD